jgi:hypothetical protein
MNKSFVLSGGRKNDRFESGFKPATLPDWQNGNVKKSRLFLPSPRVREIALGRKPPLFLPARGVFVCHNGASNGAMFGNHYGKPLMGTIT